jgi:hypothetical protein
MTSTQQSLKTQNYQDILHFLDAEKFLTPNLFTAAKSYVTKDFRWLVIVFSSSHCHGFWELRRWDDEACGWGEKFEGEGLDELQHYLDQESIVYYVFS